MHGLFWLPKLRRFGFAILQTIALVLFWAAAPAWAAEPIKVGFSMGMTGANRAEWKATSCRARNLARQCERQRWIVRSSS